MRKFFVSLVIVLLALFLQLKIFAAPFTLAALVSSAFFIGFSELFFFSVAVFFILNWQPVIVSELVVFFAIPLLAYGLKRFFPWPSWLTNMIFAFAGTFAFYIVGSMAVFRADPGLVLRDASLALVFGIFAFFVQKEAA